MKRSLSFAIGAVSAIALSAFVTIAPLTFSDEFFERVDGIIRLGPAYGMYYAKNYGSCTWDDANDVSSCITAAATAAGAAGGGRIMLPAGTFGLLNTAQITQDSVRLVGVGAAGAGRCATTLKWLGNGTVGTPGGTVVRFGTSGMTAPIYRTGISQVCIDANSLAAIAVEEWSVNFSEYAHLFVNNYTSKGWSINQAVAPAFPGHQYNTYIDAHLDGSAPASLTAKGWVQEQNSHSSDSFRNTWINSSVKFQNGTGFECGSGDNNVYINFQAQPIGAGTTGKGVVLKGSNSANTVNCFGNFWYGPAVGDGSHANSGFWAETGSTSNATQNWIFGMKTGDGEPTPTDSTPGGGIFVCDDNGWCNTRPRQRNVTSNVTMTALENNTTLTTNGASFGQTANLVAATGNRVNHCFVQTDQTWTITPNGTDTITIGSTVGGAGGGVLSGAVGSKLCLITHQTGKWVATSMTGSWTFSSTSAPMGEVNGGAFTTFTPTLSCPVGSLTDASAAGRYQRDGKKVHISVVITITTNGACATAINATIPVAPSADNRYELVGIGAGGAMVHGSVQTTPRINIKKYDNTYPGADSTTIVVSGTYESN